ncbi:glucan biosynthesis protein [Rhodovulum euryhalinum]|uniref:Glucans biosynthesis protein n=1 Tax=Rhodovulum euryhalinum TaxID=35805 RepID=A0A4R2KMF1_9RHOB|nr:glucan biosynthesis protein G [Rhodovulum euryhalinum]TCO71228.1 glucans biosynthesis protein [Rhodovulum euryhalinum]
MIQGEFIAGPRSGKATITRRQALGGLAGSAAATALLAPFAAAQQAEMPVAPMAEPTPVPFSFELLAERMRALAAAPYVAPEEHEGAIAGLDYDAYRRIRFRPGRARWQEDGSFFQLHAFHPGWLYKTPVAVHEVVDGTELPLGFSVEDFEYEGDLASRVPTGAQMPTIAGFRLHAPLNRADIFDEVIVFLGASYFRALGRGNVYGLSARGLAINTATGKGEEFPRFSEFWIERPVPGAARITLYAALESPSVTGAFRFDVAPGETTVVDVTARLFAREDIAHLGIAPLTSMYLLGDNDRGEFDDFRPRVHDSEVLVLNTRGGETFVRPLNNPPRLASAYLGTVDPVSFGLVQRDRGFDSYLDAGAHYELRPSLMVEPLGPWGKGTVRLVEIPSDLEGNDNIVAFWVPDAPMRRGDALEVAYRLHWGMAPPGTACSERARIVRTRVGKGGVSGVQGGHDRRKFVIDFAGGALSALPADAEIAPKLYASGGEIVESVLSRISGTDTWRLVIEARAPGDALVELRAEIAGYGRTLSETWLYQWIKE